MPNTMFTAVSTIKYIHKKYTHMHMFTFFLLVFKMISQRTLGPRHSVIAQGKTIVTELLI